ncbi:MAG: ABC transporter permease [Treponema sp.]|jgi:ribose transport system permease protein|nr:ABC transporter permease [Treponema sp.]
MNSEKRTNTFKRIMAMRGVGQVVTVLIGLIILCMVFSIINPMFRSGKNASNLLRQIVPTLLVGIGQSFVLITGNVDLSIGSVVGMSCMISATMMTKGMSPLIAVLFTLACCLVIGFINGQLVSRFKLPPFIATLGTMTIARGIAQISNNNYNTDSIGINGAVFRDLFYYGKFLGLFTPIWIAAIIWALFYIVLSKTQTGRHVYAIGSNVEAARLSGVNVINTTTIVYLISSFCAAVTGFVTCATSGMGTMDAGNMYEMFAVAASVIGGVSPLGGQGILPGTIVGASIWGVLQNGLQFAGAPVALRNIVIGVIVVVSVLLDVVIRQGNLKWVKRRDLKENNTA